MHLIIDGNQGIHIPKIFAQRYRNTPQGIEMKEVFDVLLQGADHPDYWEMWDRVLFGFSIFSNEVEYFPEQGGEGDVWLMTEDERKDWEFIVSIPSQKES